MQDKQGLLKERLFHHGLKMMLYPVDRLTNNWRYTTFGKRFYFSRPYQLRWESSRCKEYVTHIDFYASFYNRLADKKSKDVLLVLLKYALTDNEKFFAQINDSNEIHQYFDSSIFQRQGKETFLDCGAFIGDTVIDYMEYYGSDEDTIISFELDETNIKQYYKNTEKYAHITLINKGVWDCMDVMYQASNGSGARVSKQMQGNALEVDTIDHMVKTPVQFIKMDIEGAEERALKGAARHIKNDMPKLAICVYHKPDDVRILSNTIDSIQSGYQYYLRHYTDCFFETVLYAKYKE